MSKIARLIEAERGMLEVGEGVGRVNQGIDIN